MKRLMIHGQRQALDSKSTPPDFPSNLKSLITLKHSAKVERARAGRTPLALDDLNPDDLVQLELNQGVKLWVRADDLQQDFGLTPTRGAAGEEIELPLVLPLGSASRGVVGDWIIKGLKVFGLDPVGATTDFIKDKVEGVLQPGPGLYRWKGKAPSDYSRIKPLETGKSNKPWLVFLHGTASSSEGSFGGLWEDGANARMLQLLAQYPDRVLAFQHRTLSQSPIQNAVELVRQFPKGARLHLVSHSRGGLVGELLCRSMVEGRFPFDQEDLGIFVQADRDDDRKELEQLGNLLQQKELVIERFVRVGCPARGTTLASGRLDRYLSILLNVVQAIPGLKANPVVEGLSAFLLAVVKNRTKPEELPGLEAQMPGSPLIRILNRPGVRTRADLHVLGGDLEGEGIVGRLKTFVTDLFYREDHDLVVNTPAMLGGTERTREIQYWIDTGKNVDHFHYFRNPDTASRLLQALIQAEPHSLYHRLEGRPSEITEEDYRKRAPGLSQPVVYVLPGIMGSELNVGKDRVWVDMWDLAMGGLKKLKLTAENVVVGKPIASGYKDLVRFLAHSHEVKPFAYDWRKSLLETAQLLRKSLEETLEKLEGKQPVRIVAHSMGGLVVRVMLATPEGKNVWDRMCEHPGARFIMLGTPNGGSHAITAMLMGRDPLVRKLDLLDLTNSQTTLLGIISRFDGVLQLLPHTGTLDVFRTEVWETLQEHDRPEDRGMGKGKIATSESAGIFWPLPDTAQLTNASKITTLIRDSPIDPQRMIYVAGCAAATPCDVSIDLSAKPDRRIQVLATSAGDGRVPWETGIPAALKNRTYYVDCEHGDLANFPEAFEGLVALLNSGVTTKLSQTPPARRGVIVAPSAIAEGMVEMFPNEEDLIASALGSSRVRKTKLPPRKVRVKIINDNLSRASSPVAVGHYAGDTIVSAEAYLDRQLNGRLRERQRLGLYPNTLNTSAVVLNDQEDQQGSIHPGAIVVGLGMVGELTPGGLTTSMSNAIVNYALECLEAHRKRCLRLSEVVSDDFELKIPLTTLLIGTGAGGFSLNDSLQALLNGVLQANRRLRQLKETRKSEDGESPADALFEEHMEDGAAQTVSIDSVEVLELFQDRAIQATKALRELARSGDFQKHLHIEELLVEGAASRQRAFFVEDAAWWQRLRIVTQPDGSLKFESLTNRARMETYLQPAQRKLIERFLKRASSSTQTDFELSNTLFELLIPNRLKEYAPDRRDIVLVLDEESAEFPWELLNNRYDPQARPLSVEAGMIRQLAVRDFRENVLHGTERNALVIGDPTSGEPSGKFAPLPGAAAEAREVAKLIRHYGYRDVVELVESDADPEHILTALYKQPYRILHCAAHGVYQFPLEEEDDRPVAPNLQPTSKNDPCVKPKTVKGMVLGDGLFLTPAEIQQMRYVPELVFLNCCHLGRTNGSGPSPEIPFHRLASNLGTQLIQMGVRAVIAAGWAVDDTAAKVFARKFYEEMFQNRFFGDAVRLARQEIYLQYGGSNTWGAYQCYGDPDFSLKDGSRPGAGDGHMVAPVELRVELYNLVQTAQTAEPKDESRIRQQLDDLQIGAGQGWMDSSAMCAAFGKAYGELGLFDQAVQFYDRGRTLEPADATVESLEQLANLKVRWALKQSLEMLPPAKAKTDDKAGKQEIPIKDLIDDAENILNCLIKIQPTQERYALKGKVFKGRAVLYKGRVQRKKALQQMEEYYGKGYELGREAERHDVFYPLVNQLAAKIVLSWGTQKSRTVPKGKTKQTDWVNETLSELEREAEELRHTGRSFWEWGLKPECRLLNALYVQRLTVNDHNDILKGYQEAKRREGSAKHMDSVVENIRFFEAMLSTNNFSKAPSALAQSLKKLREGLESK
ncbi:DUF7379 domain-containing protein [Nitrospira sp. T9]|uniref:CHAT domain-containing protein n=1 Tax=unclassified Nitrospira TaxID=2652172 RepID=UPI003F9DC15F